MEQHSRLIDQLGGTGALCRALGLKHNTIAGWRERGISWRWRPKIAEMARKARLKLPKDFLEPDGRDKAA